MKGRTVRKCWKNKEYRTTLSLLSTVPLYPPRAARTRAYTRVHEGVGERGKHGRHGSFPVDGPVLAAGNSRAIRLALLRVAEFARGALGAAVGDPAPLVVGG